MPTDTVTLESDDAAIVRPILYTIGYGNRRPADFFAMIPDNVIVIDVRRTPSGWTPEYSYKRLLKRLRTRYHSFTCLGNISGSQDIWVPANARQARNTLDLLANAIANGKVLCLMCSEISPTHCHRRFVAQELVNRVPSLLIRHW